MPRAATASWLDVGQDKSDTALWTARNEFAVNAYLAMHEGLDLQSWFEEQI